MPLPHKKHQISFFHFRQNFLMVFLSFYTIQNLLQTLHSIKLIFYICSLSHTVCILEDQSPTSSVILPAYSSYLQIQQGQSLDESYMPQTAACLQINGISCPAFTKQNSPVTRSSTPSKAVINKPSLFASQRRLFTVEKTSPKSLPGVV
mgnify:CR=1 FL=1